MGKNRQGVCCIFQVIMKELVTLLFETNKDKGRAGISAAIAYFGMNGYTVCIPLNDTQDYDLIVDDGNDILKISCKATGSHASSGYSVVSLRNCGGTNGSVYGREKEKNNDYVFVLNEKGEEWLLPQNILTSNSMTLGEKYSQYKIE